MNIAQRLFEKCQENQQHIAIVENGRHEISAGDLANCISNFAAYLDSCGLSPGDRVIMQVASAKEFVATFMGLLAKGGVPVFLEPQLGKAIYLSRIAHTEPKWLVCQKMLKRIWRIPYASALLQQRGIFLPPKIPKSFGLKEIVVPQKRANERTFACLDLPPETECLIFFTGGTTSEPLGVRYTVRGIEHVLKNIQSLVRGYDIDTLLADTPQQVLYALMLGMTAYTVRGAKQKRAKRVRALLQSGRVHAYFGSPYIWVEMMKQMERGQKFPNSLRAVFLGGAPVTLGFLEQLHDVLDPSAHIRVVYGMTEMGAACSASAEEKRLQGDRGDCVGTPFENVDVDIRDPQDGIGEVMLRSPALFAGYLGQSVQSPDEFFATGDLGQWDKETRQLFLCGRKKDMIIRKGVNLYPATIESTLKDLRFSKKPLVTECALIGVWRDDKQDEDVVLFFQASEGMNAEEVEKQLRQALGEDSQPDAFVCVDQFPVTGRQNKLDRKALRKLGAKHLGIG